MVMMETIGALSILLIRELVSMEQKTPSNTGLIDASSEHAPV